VEESGSLEGGGGGGEPDALQNSLHRCFSATLRRDWRKCPNTTALTTLMWYKFWGRGREEGLNYPLANYTDKGDYNFEKGP